MRIKMDGTLTEPNNIDFKRMRNELGITDSVDILAHIEKLEGKFLLVTCLSWQILNGSRRSKSFVKLKMTRSLRCDYSVVSTI